jgi:xanthine/CO dehydrogenase XdhC/CoxF family maturation factor
MLLKGDVKTIVQEWGSMPRHAGPRMGLASDGQFSPRVSHAALDALSQARLLHFYIAGETTGMRWMLIEVGTRIGCV